MRREHLSVLSPAELFKYFCRVFPCLVLAYLLTAQGASAQTECRPARQIYNFAQGEIEEFGFVFIGVEVSKVTEVGPNTAIAHIDKVYRYPLQRDGTTRLTIVHRENLATAPYDPNQPASVEILSDKILTGMIDEFQTFELPMTEYLDTPICSN